MRTLIEYAVTNALMATLLALIVWGVTRVVRRPAVRNALWLLVLVRLLLPPVWAVPMPFVSFFPEEQTAVVSEPSTPSPAPSVPEPNLNSELTAAELDLVAELLEGSSDLPLPPAPVVQQPVIASAPLPPLPADVPPSNRFTWIYSALGIIWLTGTLWIAIRSVRSIRRFGKLLRDAYPVSMADRAMTAELASAMGLSRCPGVYFVPGRLWPSVWAPVPWRREAKLLIPAGLWPLLDADQRRAVLAHELSHCRRGDPWVRWLEMVAVALYWWYLPLGWVRRQLRQSEEECCDMWVVAALSGRRAYATALVETAVYLSGPEPAFSSALASGAGPVDDIQRRITMIMSANWPAGLTRLGMAAILGLGTVGIAVGPTLGTADAQDKEKKEFPKKNGPKDKRGPDEPRPDDVRGGEPGPAPRENDPEGGGRGPGPGPADRPRGERPEGGRGEGAPVPGPRDRKVNEDEIRLAREEAEKARADLRKAVDRMVAAETKLARIQGRSAGAMGGGGMGGPGFPGMMGGGGGGGFPGFPGMMPGGGGGSGGGFPGAMPGSGSGAGFPGGRAPGVAGGDMRGPGGPGAEGGSSAGGRGIPGGRGNAGSGGSGAEGGGGPGGFGRGGAAGQPGGPGPGAGAGAGGFGSGGAPGVPGGPGPGAGGFGGGTPPGIPGGPGPDMNRRNEELERQVNDLRKAVDEMRQMLKEQMRQRDRENERK